ncbi:MAG: hypothetical protein AB8B99_12160 [Phormidesmis sp.]
MSGSVPKPPKKGPRPAKRRRKNAAMPWLLIVALFIVYALSGLLLSAPIPPFWLWAPALIGSALLIIGIHRPMQPDNKRDYVGILAYLGALALVVTLAIAANYVGKGEAFDNARFFTAVFLLAFLTLLSIVLTATAAIFSAQTGAKLLTTMSYRSSLGVLLGTSFLGLFVGGLIGYLSVGISPSI